VSTSSSPSPSDPDRQDRAERLYERARELPPGARAGFLDEACGGDGELRGELQSLLDHAEAAERLFTRLAETVIPPDAGEPALVGPYQVLECVGVGGMGAVYRARDARLDRDVALKLLPVHEAGTPAAEERLLREARAAAALEHPNVCTVHEIGAGPDGRPYIAMAFYDGETLKERLARGRLPAAEAVDVAAQIVRGLAAAHAHGLVHRDVKPGNIMLVRDGTVKLLDFGLATAPDVTLTRPGATPGTVAYMSPEQARGDPVGPESDLWSLGVVLWEMLAAARPFRGGHEQAVIHAILHSEPESVREHAPDVPEALERVLGRLLRKDPRDRYLSADELLADLTAPAATARGVGPPLARRRARPRVTWIAAAGVLLLAVASAAFWLGERGGASGAATEGGGAGVGADSRLDQVRTIAVLPFTNVSGDPEEEFFSDGLTEELIGVLSRVRAIRTAARRRRTNAGSPTSSPSSSTWR
jgi:serine/threonine-protein kinase